MGNDPATAVIITYRKNRLNTRLIFGTPHHEIRRGWHRKFALFMPGDVFGYERWRGNKYGTQDWQFWICAAASTGLVTRIPGIIPGAELLAHVSGKTRVKRAFTCLDGLREDATSLEAQPKLMWRELHNRLMAGEKESDILRALMAELPC